MDPHVLAAMLPTTGHPSLTYRDEHAIAHVALAHCVRYVQGSNPGVDTFSDLLLFFTKAKKYTVHN